MHRLLITSAILLAARPGAVAAQSLLPSGTGLSLAADVSYAHFDLSGGGFDGTDNRIGGRVELAYGATPRLSIVGAFRPLVATADDKDYTVNGVELGLRYLAKAGRALRPFAEGGLAIRNFRYEAGDEFTSRNVGPWAGLGVMRLTNGHLAVEGAITWTSSTFDNWQRNGTATVAESASWSGVGVRTGVRYFLRAR